MTVIDTKAVIDTNVLTYDTFEDSIHHKKATSILDKLATWFIPSIVIHEYVWVLRSLDVKIKDIVEKVEEYIYNEKIKLINERKEDILNALYIIHKEGRKMAKYNDKVILSVAMHLNAPIFTFDAKLAKQARKFNVKVF